jgi:hypothetical protein
VSKKPYLPEAEIQQLEGMDLEMLRTALGAKAVEKFHLLLKSYRLARKVAYAAWGFMDGDKNGQEKLASALHGYAPEHFQEPAADIAVRIDTLMELYESSETLTAPEVKELIFQRICALQALAAKV